MTVDKIRTLRSFAFRIGQLQFAHLCDAALAEDGEGDDQWAIDRVEAALTRIQEIDASSPGTGLGTVRVMVISAVDCTRPDGAIARTSIEV